MTFVAIDRDVATNPERRHHGAWWARRQTEKLVGACMMASGSVHGLVTQEHFKEWWGYGVFFLVSSICLIGFGLALLTDAIDPRYTPGDVWRLRWWMYLACLAGNVTLIAMYIVTRTIGIPLGPGSGSVETVGGPDVIAKVTECVAVAGLVLLALKARPKGVTARR